MEKSKAPVPVIIIAIFYFINAFLLLAAGAFSLFLGGKGIDLLDLGPSPNSLIFAGIAGLIISGLYVFVGRDLLRGKKWARIAAIILSGLAMLEDIIFLILGDIIVIIPLVINGAIFFYLLFDKDAKKMLSKR